MTCVCFLPVCSSCELSKLCFLFSLPKLRGALSRRQPRGAVRAALPLPERGRLSPRHRGVLLSCWMDGGYCCCSPGPAAGVHCPLAQLLCASWALIPKLEPHLLGVHGTCTDRPPLWDLPPSLEVSRDMWVWHLGTGVSDGLGTAGGMFALDRLRGFSNLSGSGIL